MRDCNALIGKIFGEKLCVQIGWISNYDIEPTAGKDTGEREMPVKKTVFFL